MARTIAEIDADIAEVSKAKRDLLVGKRPQAMKHGEREISFGSNFRATLDALNQELSLLQVERARAGGGPSPLRPLGV